MVLLGLLVFLSLANRQSRGQEMTVNEFEAAVNAGQVASAKFLEVDHKIVGELKDGTAYEVVYPDSYQETLVNELKHADVPYESDPQNGSPLIGSAPPGGSTKFGWGANRTTAPVTRTRALVGCISLGPSRSRSPWYGTPIRWRGIRPPSMAHSGLGPTLS